MRSFAVVPLTLLTWILRCRSARVQPAVTSQEGWQEVWEGKTYGRAVELFISDVLPNLNHEWAECQTHVQMDKLDVADQLQSVEVRQAEDQEWPSQYRITLQETDSTLTGALRMTFTFDEALDDGGFFRHWTAEPEPCDLLAARGDDDFLPSEDPSVQKAMIVVREKARNTCNIADVDIAVASAHSDGATHYEQLDLWVFVEATREAHHLRFEFLSEADVRMLTSDVPFCDMFPTSGTSFAELGAASTTSLAQTAARLRAQRRLRQATLRQEQRRAARALRAGLEDSSGNFLLPTWRGDLPKDFNWPDQRPACFPSGAEVQDQGSCGSCWAFATLGAVGDRHCIAQGTAAMTWSDGKLKRFSVQDFLSCYKTDGCEGGTLAGAHHAMETSTFSFERDSPYFAKCFLKTVGGVVNDDSENGECDQYRDLDDHPHNGKPCNCWSRRPTTQPKCKDSARQKIQIGWSSIDALGDMSPSKQEEIIMRFIREAGPVAVGFAVWADFRPLTGSNPEVPYRRYDPEAAHKGGHAVIITGWGETAEGERYWWARNSWGRSFGINGYFKVLRGENAVGFEGRATFSVVEAPGGSPMTRSELGLRPPWVDSMVKNWGEIRPAAGGKWEYASGDRRPAPLSASFATHRMKIKKDVFDTWGKHLQGMFNLLVLEIPYSCMGPCVVKSKHERFNVTASDGTLKEIVRGVEGVPNDDSWSEGVLFVKMQAEDPLQGARSGSIEVEMESPLRDQVMRRWDAKGMAFFDVEKWYLIPTQREKVKVNLPEIPVHRVPDKASKPLLPFKVTIDKVHFAKATKPWELNELKLSLTSSEPSLFHIRISDKETGALILEGQPSLEPSKWAWPHLGGYLSLGGSDYKNALQPFGKCDGRVIRIDVTATCDKFANPLTTTTSGTVQVPKLSKPPKVSVHPVSAPRVHSRPMTDFSAVKMDPATGKLPTTYAEQQFEIWSNFPPDKDDVPGIVFSCRGRGGAGYKQTVDARSYDIASQPTTCRGESDPCYVTKIVFALHAPNCDIATCSANAEVKNAMSGRWHSAFGK